ncbi:MAG: AbrB/MazE/SpoVT family DNA-binding domain-containing protein [Actinomycetota bacterium]
METRIQRWGNSLGVRIPKAFAEEADVDAGSAVDVTVVNGDLVLRPLRRRSYDLSTLVKGIDQGNVHEAIETGPSVGREAW